MTTISSIDARYAQDQVGVASRDVTSSVANLVSGKRSDANVADLSVGTILATRVSTLRVTVGNAGQAKSLLETAKGALDTVLSLLQQQKNLAVKSADDSLSDNERGFLDQEFQAIVSEIDRISANANFNGKALLDGSISGVSTVDTSTGLSAENYGIISAGDVELKGTVATGDLITTESKAGTNRIAITTNGTATESGTITVRDEANGNAAAITFTYGATTNATIDAIATAFNEFSGTNAKTAQNFTIINNGDDSFTIQAKETGTHLDNFDFQITDSTTAALVAVMGIDGTPSDVDTNGGAAIAFSANTAITGTDTAIGVNGTFSTVAAYNVGETAGVTALTLVSTVAATTLTITDVNNVLGYGANTTAVITWTGNAGAEADITDIIDIKNGGNGITAANGTVTGSVSTASAQDILDHFVFEKSGTGTIIVTGAVKGTSLDGFTFEASANCASATLGGVDIDLTAGAPSGFGAGTRLVASADRAVATTDATINANLVGNFSNFKATFTQGSGTLAAANGQSVVRNSVVFSVDVNGKTYISDPVYLSGGSGGSNLEVWGNKIAANQVITFSDPDGPKDSDGVLTDNAFSLRLGTTAITLSDLSTAAKAQQSANTIADAFETQLASVTINQNRSLSLAQIDPSSSDHRITAAVGTVLEGIQGFDSVGTNVANYNAGDITLLTDGYSSTGTLGNIGSFDVDRLRNRITTTIDGETFTAYLSSDDLPAIGNVVAFGTNLDGTSNLGSYNATTKVLDLQDGTSPTAALSVTGSAKLHFFSSSTTDGRVLSIDLGNVSANTAQLNVSSNEGELGLESALNGIFGVASNESLSFQVGAASTDTIGVSIGSAKTTDVYKDNSGVVQVLSVGTITNAIEAGEVIDNAIRNVVSLISDISAKITAFNSAIQNNQASIQNADAARSKLLDTDYTQESTRFAEARVRVDAATAVLSQVNSRIQNLLQLLQR